jgi:SpoVK/Ycf46/Vps4 family AAA+-type ATPase
MTFFKMKNMKLTNQKMKNTQIIKKNKNLQKSKSFLFYKKDVMDISFNINEIVTDMDQLLTELVLNLSEEVFSSVSLLFQEIKKDFQTIINSYSTYNDQDYLEKIIFPLYRIHNTIIFHLIMSTQETRNRLLPSYMIFLEKNKNIFLPISVPLITEIYLNPLDDLNFKMKEYLKQRHFITPNFEINNKIPSYNVDHLSMTKTIPSVYPDVLGIYIHKPFNPIDSNELDIENLSLENSIEEIIVFRSKAFKPTSSTWKEIINYKKEKKLLYDYFINFVKSKAFPTKSILLHGQNTDDKQKLVELMAKQFKMPFYYISAYDLFLNYKNKKDYSNLEKLKNIKPDKPCVLFIDEIDTFQKNESFWEELLSTLKDIQQRHPFLIIGNNNQGGKTEKTDFPYNSFDIEIYFPLWNSTERKRFFRIKGRQLFKDDLTLLNYIADNTTDWEVKDLKQLFDLIFFSEHLLPIQKINLETVQEIIHFLKLTRVHPDLLFEMYKKNLLYHKAGHILVELFFKTNNVYQLKKEIENKLTIDKTTCHNCLTVVSDQNNLYEKPIIAVTDNLIHQIFYSLSGPIAEKNLLKKDYQSFHSSEDLKQVDKLIMQLKKDQKYEYLYFLQKLFDQVDKKNDNSFIINFFKEQSEILIKENKPILEEIVNCLQNNQPINKNKIYNFFLPPSLKENNLFTINKSDKINQKERFILNSYTKENKISLYSIFIWAAVSLTPILTLYHIKKFF